MLQLNEQEIQDLPRQTLRLSQHIKILVDYFQIQLDHLLTELFLTQLISQILGNEGQVNLIFEHVLGDVHGKGLYMWWLYPVLVGHVEEVEVDRWVEG